MDIKTYLSFWLKGKFFDKKLVSYKLNNIVDQDIEILKNNNIKLAVFDFDDTLSDFHGTSISNGVETFLNELGNAKINIGIFSNCSVKRTEILQKIFKDKNYYVSKRSDKPSKDGFIEIMNHFNVSSSESIMFGDKLGTDIYGSFLAKYKLRVLVKPLSYVVGGRKAPIKDRMIRAVEKLFI